jgi:hypothetical protein
MAGDDVARRAADTGPDIEHLRYRPNLQLIKPIIRRLDPANVEFIHGREVGWRQRVNRNPRGCEFFSRIRSRSSPLV